MSVFQTCPARFAGPMSRSFISGAWRQTRLRGHCRIAPNLAVEVISPNDSYEEVEEKVREYLAANVELVWVINPATRSVRVHRADGSVTDLDENSELDGENVVPGFRCRVCDLFAVRA